MVNCAFFGGISSEIVADLHLGFANAHGRTFLTDWTTAVTAQNLVGRVPISPMRSQPGQPPLLWLSPRGALEIARPVMRVAAYPYAWPWFGE